MSGISNLNIVVQQGGSTPEMHQVKQQSVEHTQTVAAQEQAARVEEAKEQVPDTDWRWILQALNPEPDQASLPLLGRAYQGHSESLLLRKSVEPGGRLLTIRLWDSGIRLRPEGQVLYLGQMSEEELVQSLGLFSYWRSTPMNRVLRMPVRDALSNMEQKIVNGELLLIRD